MSDNKNQNLLRVLVTGGAGFIGAGLVRRLVKDRFYEVLNLDKLTYAGNLDSLASIKSSQNYRFENGDICDRNLIEDIFVSFKPQIVIHLAAESHVDRSIYSPDKFISTNIVGTFNLLEVARKYWDSLGLNEKERFRFLHVSTDEVYGDLGYSDDKFRETSAYRPNSPYSASKASADHLVRSWNSTYGFPAIITNCSNNYGPNQFPEKLIPKMIISAIAGNSMCLYGNGEQVRDWLHVEDHIDALITISLSASAGSIYCIGGNNQVSNIDLVTSICQILEEMMPIKPFGIKKYEELIEFVDDRPGHDIKYAIDASKIYAELGWAPKEKFIPGLRKTIRWYLDHEAWWKKILDYSNQRLEWEKSIK